MEVLLVVLNRGLVPFGCFLCAFAMLVLNGLLVELN
jgi:hypothetical protein